MTEGTQLATYQLDGLQRHPVPVSIGPPPGIVLRFADLPADLPVMIELCQASFLQPSRQAAATHPVGDTVPSGAEETIDDGVDACAEVAGLLRHPGLAPPGAFLALDGALAVGMVVGRVEVPAHGDGIRRAAVELLAVRPGHRRRGIGRALLGRLLAWLAARGVEVVVASTEDPVVAAMLAGHGFRPRAEST